MIKYIPNVGELQEELNERKENKEKINKKLEIYWKERGIDLKSISYREILGSFGNINGDRTNLILWRNFITPNLEGLIVAAFADLLSQKMDLNIKLKLISFPRDHFDERNLSKKTLVSLKAINNDDQCPIDYSTFKETPLDKIKIGEKTLSEIHSRMAREIFPETAIDNDTDLLKIFSIAMAGALEKTSNRGMKRIGSIYVENPKTEKVEQFFYQKNECSEINFVDKKGNVLTISDLIDRGKKGMVRPSAKWYYLLFLSMFVNGDRVLLETFDNAPSMIPMVEKALSVLKNEIGYEPLIIKTPVYVPDISTEKNIPIEEYPFWVLNGCPNKKQHLLNGSAYKNANSDLHKCLPFETSLLMIGMDIVSQS